MEHTFDNVRRVGLDRRYLLDRLYRSLVMLSPGAPAMNQEEAMRLVADLEESEGRLGRLIADLRRLADEADTRHSDRDGS